MECKEEAPDVDLWVVYPFEHAFLFFLVEEKTCLMIEVKKKARISRVWSNFRVGMWILTLL